MESLKRPDLHVSQWTPEDNYQKKGLNDPIQVLREEQCLIDDVVVTKNVLRTVLPSELIQGFKVSDFYLENLASIGAIDGLKPCTYGDVDVDSFTSSLDAVTESLDSNV